MEWCEAYGKQGLEGLKSHWQGNNALNLSREQRTDLSERLQKYRPDQVISEAVRLSQGQFWTVSDLKIGVQAWYEVSYRSEGSIRPLLHESQQQVQNQYRSRPDDRRVADFEAMLEKKSLTEFKPSLTSLS